MELYLNGADLCLVYDIAQPSIARLPLRDLAAALANLGHVCVVCGKTMDGPDDLCICEINLLPSSD